MARIFVAARRRKRLECPRTPFIFKELVSPYLIRVAG